MFEFEVRDLTEMEIEQGEAIAMLTGWKFHRPCQVYVKVIKEPPLRGERMEFICMHTMRPLSDEEIDRRWDMCVAAGKAREALEQMPATAIPEYTA